MTKSGYSYFLGAVMALGCAGCGDGLSSLEGTVTIDGSPAPKGLSLQFTPVAPDGSPSYASTDENGHYEAAFTFQRKGIQPGEHSVRLIPSAVESSMPVIGPDGRPERQTPDPVSNLPREYYEKIKTIQIESGSNDIDFELKSGK